jgi:hypothetical protein
MRVPAWPITISGLWGFAEMLAIGQSTVAGREIFDEAPISGKFERVRGSQKKRH